MGSNEGRSRYIEREREGCAHRIASSRPSGFLCEIPASKQCREVRRQSLCTGKCSFLVDMHISVWVYAVFETIWLQCQENCRARTYQKEEKIGRFCERKCGRNARLRATASRAVDAHTGLFCFNLSSDTLAPIHLYCPLLRPSRIIPQFSAQALRSFAHSLCWVNTVREGASLPGEQKTQPKTRQAHCNFDSKKPACL